MSRIHSSSVLVLLLLAGAGCASRGADGGANTGVTGCAPSASANGPVICVDDTANELTVSHDEVTVNDVRSDNGKPVILRWQTQLRTDRLQITFKESGCVDRINCGGPVCTAVAVKVDAPVSCDYAVEVDGHPVLDPTVVVRPCCS